MRTLTPFLVVSLSLLSSCAPPMYFLTKGISGRVLDARHGTPIEAARIHVPEADGPRFTTTESGEFSTGHLRRFFSQCPHDYLTIRVSAPGYRITEKRVCLDTEEPDPDRLEIKGVLIRLEPK